MSFGRNEDPEWESPLPYPNPSSAKFSLPTNALWGGLFCGEGEIMFV